MNARHTGLIIAGIALALDQATKAWARNSSALEGGMEVLPVFNLVSVRNEGVSFGMLGGLTPWWALAVLALGIMTGLVVWLWRTQSRFLGAALGLLIGGALGNVLDRLRYGSVTDFLDFHLQGYHWPAFNLADVAVFCGAVILVFSGPQKARAH